MKFLFLIFSLLLSTQLLFAQRANTATTLTDTKVTANQTAEQMIVGRWTLTTVNGQSTVNGQPQNGYLNFTTNNAFDGLLFGERGSGTYSIVYKDGKTILQALENGNVSEILIVRINNRSLVIIADRVQLEFTK